VLVIRRDRIGKLVPRYVGGGSLAEGVPGNNDSFEGVTVAFHPTASRFEFGMRNPAVYAGIVHAIDYLNAIGWDAIEAHERETSTLLKTRLAALDGVSVQTPESWENSSGLVNFKIDGVSGNDIRDRFWNDFKIVQRAVRWPDGVRLSTAYFSSPEDVDRVVEAVTKIRDGARTKGT
jgi:selenocysteine lyase/cysteine desulfurase